jgi:two-component system, response regulator YesN
MNNNVIKVLIVDDEHLVRGLLKRCIDWNSIGMEIIGEATSGEEAIALVNKYKPDLVFTDICMANIDGIEFADAVIKKYPSIKVVVISGYDDFKYAQRSIRAGIKDYLIKPIDDEVVLETALKMKMEILQDREFKTENTIHQKQFINNVPILIERLFNRLIHPILDINEVRRQMSYLNFKFKYDTFQVAVIEIILKKQDSYEEGGTIYYNKILNELKKYLKQNEDISIFFDDNYRITILNNGEKGIIEKVFDNIKVNVLCDFKCCYSIGIGTTKNDMVNIERSYKEALDALNYRIILGNNSVIKYDDINLPREIQEDITIKVDDKLKVYFLSGSEKIIQDIIDGIFDTKDPAINMSMSNVKEYAFSYISTILEIIKELDIDIKELHSRKYNIYEEILELDTIPDIKRYVTDISSKVIELINYYKSKKLNKLIDDISLYMKLNFGDCELSLSKVAHVFFINPSYLSRIFKKEMGVNFMEYLIKLRIDKAIMLINNKDLKAYEIGEEVGISDSSYFSTCFKRYTGFSISEYKKIKLNK